MPAPSSSCRDTGPGLRLVAVPRADGCAVAVLHRPGLGARVTVTRDGVALEHVDVRTSELLPVLRALREAHLLCVDSDPKRGKRRAKAVP